MSRRESRVPGGLSGPTGDPAELHAAAARFRQVASRALATSGARGAGAAELTLVWSGDDATRALGELAALSTRAQRVLPHLGAAGSALARYADSLEHTIRTTTSLEQRASAAREEHARTVSVARSTVLDPVAHAAATARADQRLAERLDGAHRAYGAAMDDFLTVGTRCAHTLAALTSRAVPRGSGGSPGTPGTPGTPGIVRDQLIGDLPCIGQQIAAASRPAVGHTTPRAENAWWETALENAGDAAAWTYNHTAVPLVNGAANVGQAIIEHPEDLLEMALGSGMIIVGAGGEIGGLALDATGVGAVAGVPINIAAAGVIATGAVTVGQGVGNLANHATQKDIRLLKEVDGPSSGRGQPGDPLPDSMRPDTAGASWEGRVSDTGKGEVWQAPDRIEMPNGSPKNIDAIRIMDPKEGHPHGYVVFYNKAGQPLNLEGRTGSVDDYHISIRPDGTYEIPQGWAP